MAPELIKEFIAEFHREVNRFSRDREVNLGLQRRELEEVNRKLAGLIEAIAEGLRASGLQAKLDELESRKAMLEAKLAAAPPPAPRAGRRPCGGRSRPGWDGAGAPAAGRRPVRPRAPPCGSPARRAWPGARARAGPR